jgi:hypothetical protein
VAGGKGRFGISMCRNPSAWHDVRCTPSAVSAATLPQHCGIWIHTGVASEASGKRRVAVVPRPGVDVMISVPPWAAMIS